MKILRKPGQAMEDAQARAALKHGDVEKIRLPERIEGDLLHDLLCCILLFQAVLRAIGSQLLLNEINHRCLSRTGCPIV